MNGGSGRIGAHYCDADFGEGESTCCREVTLKASRATDKSAVWLVFNYRTSAWEFRFVCQLYIWTPLSCLLFLVLQQLSRLHGR